MYYNIWAIFTSTRKLQMLKMRLMLKKVQFLSEQNAHFGC